MLDGAGALDTMSGPREFEQVTVELLGADMYAALQAGQGGVWFAWWFEESIDALEARVVEESGAGAGTSAVTARLAGTGTSALASVAAAACRRVRKLMADADLPAWLDDLPRTAATGGVFRMRDEYGDALRGTRLTVR